MSKNGMRPKRSSKYLRMVELETGKELAVLNACRDLSIIEQHTTTGRECIGCCAKQATHLKALKQENPSLKRIVATKSTQSCQFQGSRLGNLLSPARSHQAQQASSVENRHWNPVPLASTPLPLLSSQ